MDDRIYSVNDVTSALERFCGRTVRIRCVVEVAFEGDSIWHLPKRERLAGFGSSLWASFDHEALGLGREELAQFVGRHVVVTATVDCEFDGHLGAWPASVLVSRIDKVKRE